MMTTSNLEPIKMQRMLKIMLGDKKMLRLHASKNNTKKTLSFPNNLSLSMAKSHKQTLLLADQKFRKQLQVNMSTKRISNIIIKNKMSST